MKYMLLIAEDENRFESMSEADVGKLMGEYGAFHDKIEKSGVLVEAHRLRPTPTATTVRVRGGETLTTDGPFAETKEQLGGYYVIDVDHLDDAIRWAAAIPSAKNGSVEVRPVWEE